MATNTFHWNFFPVGSEEVEIEEKGDLMETGLSPYRLMPSRVVPFETFASTTFASNC